MIKIVVSLIWAAMFAALTFLPLLAFAADGSGDCTDDAIQAWHDLAGTVDGDSYSCDSGTFSVDAAITITKGVSIIGAGIGNTIVEDDSPVLKQSVFVLDTVSGRSYRISGIQFDPGTRSDGNTGRQAVISILGDAKQTIRIDHCYFGPTHCQSIVIQNEACPLIDNNDFLQNGGNDAIEMWHEEWNGGDYGDESWSEAVVPGSFDAVYIEYNTFAGTGSQSAMFDTFGGARAVLRHNTIDAMRIGTHGTDDGSGRDRGLRWFEIYGNTFLNADSSNRVLIRGGTGIVFDNDWGGGSKSIQLRYYRGEGTIAHKYQHVITPTYGAAAWDLFDLTDTFGTPGDGIFLTGTAAAGSGLSTLVVSPDPGWTADQWAGYLLYMPSPSAVTQGYFTAEISENTSDTLTFRDSHDSGDDWIATSGDSFEIWRLLLGIDSTGAGQSDLYSHGASAPFPAVDLNQERNPVMIWSNTNGADAGSSTTIREDYHYLTDTGAGINSGLAASRPASGSQEFEGYWSTDTEVLSRWEDSAWSDYWQDPGTHPAYAGETPTDSDPPTPDPLTFSTAPAESGPSSVTMTATTASDATPPVQYRVRIDGSTETDWQASPIFTISGLSPATEYDFEVKARDSAETPNETAYSSISSATTAAASLKPSATVTTIKISGTLRIIVE